MANPETTILPLTAIVIIGTPGSLPLVLPPCQGRYDSSIQGVQRPGLWLAPIPVADRFITVGSYWMWLSPHDALLLWQIALTATHPCCNITSLGRKGLINSAAHLHSHGLIDIKIYHTFIGPSFTNKNCYRAYWDIKDSFRTIVMAVHHRPFIEKHIIGRINQSTAAF